MTDKHLVLAAALAGSAFVQLAAPRDVAAQSSTAGAIQGQVTDAANGEPLAGVTIIVSSPVLQGTQTAISDDAGLYKISDLPPGTYLVTFYINQAVVERSGITVGVNKTTPVFQAIKEALTGGEVVRVIDTAPAIDPNSTSQGITIDKNYLRNLPVPGRTFEAALGAAAGSQNDGAGISFSGSSSLENQYIVDGVNTTSLTFGSIGSPVINDFIEEIEVITGGYNAEYGRATGGVVNVVTKTGSNELKGSVFGTYQPGFLTAAAERTPINSSSIDATADNAYRADVGFELGGPLIKDRLWFFVGFAPQFARTDVTRTTKRQTDCRALQASGELSNCDARSTAQGGFADGKPDVDPATGFFVTDTIDEEVRRRKASVYNAIGKLNYAATPENQVQVTFQALPGTATSPGIFGLASNGTKSTQLTTDLSAKWTAKLNDNKTEIETIVGWHRDHLKVGAIDPAFDSQPLQVLTNGTLGVWAPGFGGESQATIDGCRDGVPGTEPYPFIVNCPMVARSYSVGGPGSLLRDTEQRVSAAAALTQRVKALGSHEIKGGLDLETNRGTKSRLYSGGAFIENFVGRNVRVTRWVQLKGNVDSPLAMENTDPRFDDECSTPLATVATPYKSGKFLCDYLSGSPGSPGTELTSNTFNWSGFLRDSWQVLPNLTLNVGLRYEEQRLRYASFLQHTIDPLTERLLGKNAMTLQNMWAPRVGAIYDWTQEGRSKIYAHWGRFYESIPMDINDRSFGGEVQFIQNYAATGGICGPTDANIGGPNGTGCLAPTGAAADEQLIGASGVLVAPGIKPQYLDEIVVGAEFEIIDDLKVGVSYQNRKLGRVIEDVSTDGANTYLIANPGEWSAEDEARLVARIAEVEAPDEKRRLERQLELFRGIRIFDKPRRDYHALQITAMRRFAKQLYFQASYTYAHTVGNYPGLIAYDSGQVDPNISAQYDLIELLANNDGPLPQDRRHSIKVDGYYTFDLRKQGALTVGARVRAFSGIPENALGAHYVYGPDVSFLLPRGSLGRTGFEHGLDLHIEYSRRISEARKIDLSVYVDVFNAYDSQGAAAVDNTYAPSVSVAGDIQNANPIAGGSYEDLIWLKKVDDDGNESEKPISRNPNFRNTAARYAPAFGRLGARLTF